jgi:hypothetical protein
MIPATNSARFNHLINLARDCEKQARGGFTYKGRKYVELAAIYREMASAAMPSAPVPDALELTPRPRSLRARKLRRMTVTNGCTQAEADTALQMLLRLEGGQ